ncbi:MAG: oxidoreductase, partial [Proteobacteria bacterium]|nr:oxidoreductase [Pseudomonadota bacterium]
FRPEGILGAYEFCLGETVRQDGKSSNDGVSLFYVGVNHPYAVVSKETPSCLPDNSIAIRFHSIGGWGAITTGKNLGEVIGDFSRQVAKRDKLVDDFGDWKDIYHISANPKYGSEKKGAPTSYFLVAAPERIRVNCDLQHVNVVLCCDPKAFTHTNPLEGMAEGGAFIIETGETESEKVWKLIPAKYRQEILDKKIRIFGINGFEVAKQATDRAELQFRMQGNTFLGAFFKVSDFLDVNRISESQFLEAVESQYQKKFGRFGAAVVESNMTVMKAGFENVWEIKPGPVDAEDKSDMRGTSISPNNGTERFGDNGKEQPERPPLYSLEKFDGEFRAGYGYHQPASPLAATGAMAAATAATNSKFVSRRTIPQYNPNKCTQCMSCITTCPDAALPNTAQEISTILATVVDNYVSSQEVRKLLTNKLKVLEEGIRTTMTDKAGDKWHTTPTFGEIFNQHFNELLAGDEALQSHADMDEAGRQMEAILKVLPIAYSSVRSLFAIPEKKESGSGGVFMIGINELCKGCGECVVECGDHEALIMVPETEEINGMNNTVMKFMDLLPETSPKFLGKYDADNPVENRAAALQNHLMVRSNYEAFVAGDGSCAGCGEKSILRGVSSITEAYMRPLYLQKAERLEEKMESLRKIGRKNLTKMKKNNRSSYLWWTRTVKHVVLGLGGEDEKESLERFEKLYQGGDGDLVDALVDSLSRDAFDHRDLKAVDGRYSNGMSVMMMGGCTGCNSVYGSTHPNNPHSYPWMNSLFQDSPTTGWLFGESLIVDHSKRSVVPERLADHLLKDDLGGFTNESYFLLTHFGDSCMTDREVAELPKVWAVGGDGALGDIGFQNLSKVVLQNRPNVHVLMLDTQVYSNTGGQNSDSSVMPGGIDMNQAGAATEGKLTERKEVSKILISGHGSPYVAHVSMANSAGFYKAVIDGLHYRGTSYVQAYTSCQPEHGVPDDMSGQQAKLARDSRGAPEFIYDPSQGESYVEALSIRGNPDHRRDWKQKIIPDSTGRYNYTAAHWAHTEGRFRKHFYKIDPEEIEEEMTSLDEKLKMITQNDIVRRRY